MELNPVSRNFLNAAVILESLFAKNLRRKKENI